MLYNNHKVRYINGYPAIYNDKLHTTQYLHILEMEKFLNRKLNANEVVHHCNGNRKDYAIDNLWCFRSTADHSAFHHGKHVEQDDEGIYCIINI